MRVLIVATKAPEGDATRDATRVDHLRYMMASTACVALGGSFQDADEGWGGMALVVEAATLQEAEDWMAVEPYRVAGVFETVVIAPFRQLLPEPTPGLLVEELRAEELSAQWP